MRQTYQLSELPGLNHNPVAGVVVIDQSSEKGFINMGVVVGVSILKNTTTDEQSLVTDVTYNTITSSTRFSPGDCYIVTLPVDWLVQNSDFPVIDSVCSLCGMSFPRKDLEKNRCKVCRDKPQRS
jgi:hypothetical protein